MNIIRKILNLPKRFLQLERRVVLLEQALPFVVESPSNAWLYVNRMERMDANVSFFDEKRRRFHLARYEFAAGYAAGKVVADIACGTGYGSSLLALEGKASKVFGVDIDPGAINYARQKYGKKAEFTCSSGSNNGISDESVELVVSFETIEHIANPSEFLNEFKRILKPGGHLIISTPNDWKDYYNHHHLQHFNLEQFKSLLETTFRVEKIYNQNSGSDVETNRCQKAGVAESNDANYHLAECFIAVCRKV